MISATAERAVEHLAAQLVRGGDEVVEEREERLALARVGCDEVVEEDIARLPDAMDPAHALLEANERPRDVVVDEDVGGLKVDALVAGVGRHDDLEVAAHEREADLVAFAMRLSAGVDAGCEALRLEPFGDPFGGVGVLAEDDRLLGVARQDPVGREAVVDQSLPFRGSPVRAELVGSG